MMLTGVFYPKFHKMIKPKYFLSASEPVIYSCLQNDVFISFWSYVGQVCLSGYSFLRVHEYSQQKAKGIGCNLRLDISYLRKSDANADPDVERGVAREQQCVMQFTPTSFPCPYVSL